MKCGNRECGRYDPDFLTQCSQFPVSGPKGLCDEFRPVGCDEGAEFILHGDKPGSSARGVVVDEIRPAMETHIAVKLAEDHWLYVETLLMAHGVTDGELRKIGFHYRTAMEHGFKHGVEYCHTGGKP